MRNIDPESLYIFKAVVKYNGIAKTAGQADRVQSDIAMRIQNPQERLGVTRFPRQKEKMVLPQECELLLKYAQILRYL